MVELNNNASMPHNEHANDTNSDHLMPIFAIKKPPNIMPGISETALARLF